jgi:hypothetical protein
MFQRSRLVAALGIAALLLLLPASALANVGGAGPRLNTLDQEQPQISNVGGAGPGAVVEETQEFANVGGATPTDKNVGGAGPRVLDSGTQENVGGAGPRTLGQWLLGLLQLD